MHVNILNHTQVHNIRTVTKSQGKGQFWGFSSPLTIHCIASIAFGTHRKTAESIEMPSGVMSGLGPRKQCVAWGWRYPKERGIFSKRKRITLRLLIAVAIPSVVCLSVTLVHPTQPVEIFGNFFSPYDSPGTLLFWCQKSLVGDAPFPLKFAFKVTHPL